MLEFFTSKGITKNDFLEQYSLIEIVELIYREKVANIYEHRKQLQSATYNSLAMSKEGMQELQNIDRELESKLHSKELKTVSKEEIKRKQEQEFLNAFARMF